MTGSENQQSDALGYCLEQVRRHDRDRFLASLFAPAACRPHLTALYAFNLEVAKTAEVVSEVMIGQIRLQWWRETIEGIYAGTPRRHEVVLPLARAVTERKLTRAYLDRLIDAREADLSEAPPRSLQDLENYAEGTSATLIWLGLEVLGVESEKARRAGRHLGIAWALAGLLRALPYHARAKRLYLPQDIVDSVALRPGELFELRSTEALREAVRQVSAEAERHLRLAREERTQLEGKALPALLLGRLAARYLSVLAQAGHDPFDPRVQAPQAANAWRLLAGWFLRRY